MRKISLAPVFFSVSFALVLFAHNIGELTFTRVITPLVIICLFSIIINLLANLFLSDEIKGAIFASLFSIMFFSYGELIPYLGKNYILFTFFCILTVSLFITLKKINKNLKKVAGYLRIMSVITVAIPLISIVKYESSRIFQTRPDNPLVLSGIKTAELSKNNLPDIYYIVPDSYGSSDTLKKYFNYDNSSFVAFLENKGFYIASESASNYPKTFLSLASSLNMNYLDRLSVYKNSDDQTFTDKMIADNNVLLFLKKMGYSYYQLGSWWGSTHYNPKATKNFLKESEGFGDIGEFNFMILNSSMISPLVSSLFPGKIIGESDEDKRARVLYQFEKLTQIPQLPTPKFVFAHIISPHGPYVFGKNCEFVSYTRITGNTEEENYANQVNCLNQKLEAVIDEIIKKSSDPPVILLQADEGPNFLNGRLKPWDDWEKADSDLIKEKFPIFSAYYLPGKSNASLYPSITPVNSFREILNLYFSTDLPILPDKNYIFPDMQHLYEFREVTDIVKNIR